MGTHHHVLVEWVGGASEVTPEFTLGFGTDPDPAFGEADWGCHSSGCSCVSCVQGVLGAGGELFVMAALGDGIKEILSFCIPKTKAEPHLIKGEAL